MSNDNKTLADVQPGGMVRLGDQAERARFEAWALRECLTLHRYADGSGKYSYDRTDSAWKAWQYLSAQPSPGGQGDAWDIAELVRTDLDRQSCPDAYMRIAMESVVKHLTARHPVGEIDEAAVLRRAAAVLDMWEGDSNQTGYMGDFKDAQAILEVLAQNAAPPAQAVGEPMRSDLSGYAVAASQVRRGYDVECDRCGKFCDEGPGPCQPVGQAVDLGQFRQPVQDWLDDAQASMEEHGDYDGVFGYAIEEGTRLLALIDSQAVGK